jgi:DNA-binding Lrp family transcriptional regulator
VDQGFEVVMHVELQRKDRDAIYAFEEQVVAFPEVLEVRRMFGKIDYVVRVATRDLESLESFAIDRLQAIPGVFRVESHTSP